MRSKLADWPHRAKGRARVKLRILSGGRCCAAVLRSAEAVEAREAGGLCCAGGGAGSIEGLRSVVASNTRRLSRSSTRPRDAQGFGIKVVSDFLRNDDVTVPRMSALVVLFCGKTGLPRTVMEAGHLTDLRTGAGTALVARHSPIRGVRRWCCSAPDASPATS